MSVDLFTCLYKAKKSQVSHINPIPYNIQVTDTFRRIIHDLQTIVGGLCYIVVCDLCVHVEGQISGSKCCLPFHAMPRGAFGPWQHIEGRTTAR